MTKKKEKKEEPKEKADNPIWLTKSTKERLMKFGGYGDTMEDIIKRILTVIEEIGDL